MTLTDTIKLPTPSTASTTLLFPAMRAMSQLADETLDVMTLHTQDAFRMFTGRAADALTHAFAILGSRRFAAVVKSIWYLWADANPYADWIQIRVYQMLFAIRSQMAQAISVCEVEFEALRCKGLNLSVLRSRSPATVALGFRSSNGYATAETIVECDYHVRMVNALDLKDRMSDDDGRAFHFGLSPVLTVARGPHGGPAIPVASPVCRLGQRTSPGS